MTWVEVMRLICNAPGCKCSIELPSGSKLPGTWVDTGWCNEEGDAVHGCCEAHAAAGILVEAGFAMIAATMLAALEGSHQCSSVNAVSDMPPSGGEQPLPGKE